MGDSSARFEERWQDFTHKTAELDKNSDKLSSLRLVFFLTAAVLTGLAFAYAGRKAGIVLLIMAIVVFLVLVARHDRVIKQANRSRNLAEINKRCLQRIAGDWTSFKDSGMEFVNPQHRYTGDLDIFGQSSLFQWINTSNTYHGRILTGDLLANPRKDLADIKKRQNSVKELASKLELCQGLECEGMNSGDVNKNPEALFAYAEDKSRLFRNNWLKYIFYIWPAITIAAFVVSYYYKAFIYLPLGLLLAQVIINFWASKKVNQVLETVYSYKNKISVYQGLLELLEKEEFTDGYLLQLQSELCNNNRTASQQIKTLDKIVGTISFRFNPIIYFIINNLLFWDFHCAFALEKWKAESGAFLRKWVYNIGVFEALSNLALIAQLNPAWCYPELSNGGPFLSARSMGHPLINSKSRVANSLEMDNHICVITGSNMSGKTTLLRTAGINLVLAYAGAPVCAEQFAGSIMDIYTSMRISDDLNSGISTFYAELLRIKMIIDYSRTQAPMIFLIDEVFRGTNSRDRVAGARNVLLNLNKSWIIGLISTHDYELCEFENDPSGRIINYHFIETYQDDQIKFDYKLKPGSCRTSNARYLMKMVGIEMIE